MSTLKDRLQSILTTEPMPLVVKGWEDETGPITFYFTPLTTAELSRVNKLAELSGDRNSFGVYLMIAKLIDEAGNPVFDKGDKKWLMEHCPAAAVTDIVERIMSPSLGN